MWLKEATSNHTPSHARAFSWQLFSAFLHPRAALDAAGALLEPHTASMLAHKPTWRTRACPRLYCTTPTHLLKAVVEADPASHQLLR